MWQVSFFYLPSKICLSVSPNETSIQGIGKVSSWLDTSIASIASPVGVQKRLYNGSFQNKFKSHFLPTDFLFCASLCLVERKGNMCRNTYNKYVFSMNEKGSPRSTYQPSVGVQKAFRGRRDHSPGGSPFWGKNIWTWKALVFYKIAHSSCIVISTFLPRHIYCISQFLL